MPLLRILPLNTHQRVKTYAQVLDDFCDYADLPEDKESVLMPTPAYMATSQNMDDEAMIAFIEEHFSNEVLIEYIVDKTRPWNLSRSNPILKVLKDILKHWMPNTRAPPNSSEASQSS
jgi:hypothetical protein